MSELEQILMRLFQGGHRDYQPALDPIQKQREIDPNGRLIHENELYVALQPNYLDGNADNFSESEQKAWQHFLNKYGTVWNYGGHVLLREEIAGRNYGTAVFSSWLELSALYTYYSQHSEPPPAQVVYIHISDWKRFAAVMGLKGKVKECQAKILEHLSEFYSFTDEQGTRHKLNIQFTFTRPKGNSFKTIYVGSDPSEDPFDSLVQNRRDMVTVLETIRCQQEKLGRIALNPKYYDYVLACIIQHYIWIVRLSPPGAFSSEDLEAMLRDYPELLNDPRNQELISDQKKAEAWVDKIFNQVPPEIKSIIKKILNSRAEDALRKAMDYRIRVLGESPENAIAHIVQNPITPELLPKDFEGRRTSFYSCNFNHGNRWLGGVATIGNYQNHQLLNSEQHLKRLAKSIAHELGHLWGLKHYWITMSDPNKSPPWNQPIEFIMIDVVADLAGDFKFLPEDLIKARLFLGVQM